MIITVMGSGFDENKCVNVASMLANTTSVKFSKKTLVLPLINSKTNVNYIMNGKNSKLTIKGFSDNGIDGLMIRAVSSTINKEHFESLCSSILKAKNMLDAAKPSIKPNIERELNNNIEAIKNMLKIANEYYDFVFVIVGSEYLSMREELAKMADKNIYCVKQGFYENLKPKEKIDLDDETEQTMLSMIADKKEIKKADIKEAKVEKADERAKTILVVPDFDAESTSSLKGIKRAYNGLTVKGIPYNVRYRDAEYAGKSTEFMISNEKAKSNNPNFDLIVALDDIYQTITGYKEMDKEKEDEYLITLFDPNEELEDLETLSENEIPDSKEEIKRRFFKKKKKKTKAKVRKDEVKETE